jgi:hypothetical protein
MENSGELVEANSWKGGYYELLVCPLADSPEAACSTLKALWTFPSLNGCYLRRDLQPLAQTRVRPCESGTTGHLYGLATLPNTNVVVCGSYTTTTDTHKENTGVWHWVVFYLPLGALADAYPLGAYPFAPLGELSKWKPAVDSFLGDIARWINGSVPIRLGIVGFEVNVSDLSPESFGLNSIPKQRNEGILWNNGADLEWYPATRP